VRFANRARLTGALAVAFMFAAALPASGEEPAKANGASADMAALVEVSATEVTLDLGVIGDPKSKISVSATEYVEVHESSFELDLPALAGDYATRLTRTCYYTTMSKTYYNGFGNPSTTARMYVEWCGENGIVTQLLTQTCSGSAGYGWTYQGCTKWHGSAGFSSLTVGGDWTFRAGYLYYIYRYVNLFARLYHNGSFSGTWTMTQ
jgi:hypothetical protein